MKKEELENEKVIAEINRSDVKNPICPYCNTETVSIAIENVDGSGWLCGWSCCCDTVIKWEDALKKKYNKKERDE